jgi:hypothetical protein
MQVKERVVRPRERVRASEAEAWVGPVGHLFASPAVARVLVTFLENPEESLTLGQIKERADKAAKGTVQSGLRTLMASRLVHREGHGNRTVYRYAFDQEVGRRMLDLIEASRRGMTTGAIRDIPWLEDLMRTTPRAPMIQPFGGREEDIPTTEATERILSAAESVNKREQSRTRPGLRTRA